MAQVLRTFWEGGAVESTPNTPPHQSGVRIAPATVLTTHKTANPTLRSGSSSTLSPARSTATVTPMSSVPTNMPSHLLATSTSCCSDRIDPSFTKENALDYADNYLNHDNESEVIAFYEKCLSHGFPSVASAMLRAVFKHVLQSSNDGGEYRRLLPDDLPRSKQMAAFDTLAETSNNPVLLQKYAKFLADHYAKLGNASAAQESDAFSRIVGKLQARQSPAKSLPSSGSPVSPTVGARIGQFNSSGMSSTQPKFGSLASTPSSRRSPISSTLIGEFTREKAASELDRLNYQDDFAVMAFYSKCVESKHLAVASTALVMGLEAVLAKSSDVRVFFDEMGKEERLVEYARLAQTSRDPASVAKYAMRLGDHYIKNNLLSAVTHAETYYRIAANLTSKPGLGSFKRECETKLAQAQAEKVRLSATSSSMPKPSTPPATYSSSSSGQPPLRTAHTPPLPSRDRSSGQSSSTTGIPPNTDRVQTNPTTARAELDD